MTRVSDPWQVLTLPRDASSRDVKRRYAQLLKAHRPEDDPAAFARIRWAYEICLAYAQQPVPVEAAASRDDAPVVVRTDLDTQKDLDAQIDPDARTDLDTQDLIPQADLDTQTNPHTNPDTQTYLDTQIAPRAQAAPVAPAIDPLPELPPAMVVEVSLESMRLERLAKLRRPAVVVDELLAHTHSPEAFAAWMQACPELANFAARDAVEIELLARMAQESPPLPAFALGALDAHFGWGDYDLARRLAAGGLSPTALERILPALDNALIDARFDAHVSGTVPLYKPNAAGGWNDVIGNPKAENALLRELHAARAKRPRWWRALWGSKVNSVNHLIYGYAMRYGSGAVERLFGAPAIRFWRRAHASAVPNFTRLTVQLMRGVLIFGVLALLVGLDALRDSAPQAAETRKNTLAILASSALVYGLGVTLLGAVRWMKVVGLPWLAGWRLRVLDRLEPRLHPRIALPALVGWNLPAITFATVYGALPVAAIGVVVVGALLGILPMIGTGVLALLGAAVMSESADRYSALQLAVVAANVPTVTWLIDRCAVRMTDWRRTRSAKRDYIVMALLIVLAICVPIVSASLAGSPGHR